MTRTQGATQRSFKVLIVGGGVAGLEAMLALRSLAPDLVDVELLSAEHHFYYRPLAVVEPFDLGSVHRWELDDLARSVGATFSPGALAAVDVPGRVAHLGAGADIPYDALLLALGARAQSVVRGALTFRGPADVQPFRMLLDGLEAEGRGHLIFAVPSGPVWPLPIYELSLLTASEFERNATKAEVSIVTSEPSPLALFGARASAAVQLLLDERGITVHGSTYPGEFAEGRLRSVPENEFEADFVVACPRLAGPAIEGLPHDPSGFVPADEHSRVRAANDVYAAGDLTTFPIKQGGIAAAQADAAAESIAASAGADIEPTPFRPILRALVVSGERPTFMRVELGGGHGETSTVSDDALWWPPGKIVGKYLSPFLASLGVTDLHPSEEEDVLQIEIDAAAAHEVSWPSRKQ
jgi:sulfide:quinone oxidoreductase